MKSSRIAVSVLFFVHGFLHANLMARLPLLQSQLGVSDGRLGTLLFTVALGAMVGMPLAGALAQRLGSDRMSRLTSLFFCVIIPLLPLANTFWVAAPLFLLMGVSMGSMDVCMNGQAVYAERLWPKPIMSSFHAVFSLGMTCGAGLGALFSKFEINLALHIGIMGVLSVVLVEGASRYLVKETIVETNESQESGGFKWPNAAIVPLGLIAFCCMTGEGSMTDWSALYMSRVVGQNAAFGAVTFGTYAVGMMLGRLFGDYNTLRFGRRRLMTYNAIFAIVGLSLALGYVSVPATLVGFFLVGVGVSSIVPIVFSMAGNTPGVHPSVGIAMATSIGYTGFFIGPPSIGLLSDAYGLRIGLSFSLLLFALMFVLILSFVKKNS
jgi:MFS family permease